MSMLDDIKAAEAAAAQAAISCGTRRRQQTNRPLP